MDSGLMEKVRQAVALRGTAWLEQQLDITGESALSPAEETPRPRRSNRARPPSRLSPELTSRSRRRCRSPSRDPPASSLKRPARAENRPARNPNPRAGLGPRSGTAVNTPATRDRRGETSRTARQPADVPSSGGARRAAGGESPAVSPRSSGSGGRPSRTPAANAAQVARRSGGGERGHAGRRSDQPEVAARRPSCEWQLEEEVPETGEGGWSPSPCDVSDDIFRDVDGGEGRSPPLEQNWPQEAEEEEQTERRPRSAVACSRASGSMARTGSGVGSPGSSTVPRGGSALHATPAAAGAAARSGSDPCLLWIAGHSFVHWGALRADVRPAGRQLGFAASEVQVRWIGQRGLLWSRLLPEIHF
ncbi:uncharacterized protein [Engystomops pustulosus]|uniref:uncharacterized protein n=1 Tax=Engystomops pustulosus TaxID=76066 RepID=UPI003AFAFC10